MSQNDAWHEKRFPQRFGMVQPSYTAEMQTATIGTAPTSSSYAAEYSHFQNSKHELRYLRLQYRTSPYTPTAKWVFSAFFARNLNKTICWFITWVPWKLVWDWVYHQPGKSKENYFTDRTGYSNNWNQKFWSQYGHSECKPFSFYDDDGNSGWDIFVIKNQN